MRNKKTLSVADLGYILEMDSILELGSYEWNDLEHRGQVTIEIYNHLEDFYASEEGLQFDYKTEMYHSHDASIIAEGILNKLA